MLTDISQNSTGHHHMKNATNPTGSCQKHRIVWIDIAKAIGLLFIIGGHLTVNKYSVAKYIYWFHVPLFFCISGLLHSSTPKIPSFIVARFKHLMVPYCVLVCCVLIMIVTGSNSRISAKSLLLGGRFLEGTVCCKWWFIPCLFFTQIAGSFIVKTGKQRFVLYACCLCYYAAELLAITNTVWLWNCPFVILKLPLALEVVPMATVFYLIGFSLKGRFANGQPLPWPVTAMFTLSVAATILIDRFNVINIPFYSMNAQNYGLLLFNVAFPLISFFLVRELSITLARIHYIQKILASIGRAALPIMFLHIVMPLYAVSIFFRITGINAQNIFILWILGICIPWGVYYLLKAFSPTRKLILGEWH